MTANGQHALKLAPNISFGKIKGANKSNNGEGNNSDFSDDRGDDDDDDDENYEYSARRNSLEAVSSSSGTAKKVSAQLILNVIAAMS
jgi:hypothetical protein